MKRDQLILGIVLLSFILLDFGITYIGINNFFVYEANPFSANILYNYGWVWLFIKDIVSFIICLFTIKLLQIFFNKEEQKTFVTHSLFLTFIIIRFLAVLTNIIVIGGVI